MAGGLAITAGQGTLGQRIGGQQIQSGQGSVTASVSTDQSAALSGSASTQAQGSVPAYYLVPLRSRKVGGGTGTQAAVGSAFISAIGAVTPTPQITPTGQVCALLSGSFAQQLRNRALTGAQSNSLQGAVSTTGAAASAGSSYRNGQTQLVLDAPASTPMVAGSFAHYYTPARASVADPKTDFDWGAFGASYNYVEQYSEWAWTNPGGDWADAGGTPQGTNPHVSFTANFATSGSHRYAADITAGVQAAYTGSRWNGYIMRRSGSGTRSIASQHHATETAPTINVTYVDTSVATLACVACVPLMSGSGFTKLGAASADINPSVALEFERPTKPVTSATLNVTIENHTATPVTVQGFLMNPPLNSNPSVSGIAAAYPLDSGISASSQVLFAHRYQDGTVLGDWLIPGSTNVYQTSNWSPHLFGLGSLDNTKLPWKYNGVDVQGKWVHKQATTNVTLVDSSYSAEGFRPLASGIGAIRVLTPKSSAADGAAFSPAGSLGCDLWALLDEANSGLLDRIFVRYYVRQATGQQSPLATTKMFRQTGGAASYANPQGKFGPGAHHWTNFGGNNNVGGGNLGWTNRGSFVGVPGDVAVGGVIPGIHSQDMLGYNMHWGKEGGLGGAMFPGKWYCVEIDTQLNTWSPSGGSPSDGVQRIYIDGRLAATHTGFSYRDGPIDYAVATPPAVGLPPFRNLGPSGIALNDYNGGILPSDQDMVRFYAGIVVSKSYVGTMNIPAALPSWVPSPGNVAVLSTTNGLITNTFTSTCAPYYESFYHYNIRNDDCGAIVNPYWGTYGGVICHGSGHSGTNDNSVIVLELGATNATFKRLTNPSPLFGTGTDSTTKANNSQSNTPFIDTTYFEYTAVDGQPSSRHTYGALDIIPPAYGGSANGTLFTITAAAVGHTGGAGGLAAHKVDFPNATGAPGAYTWVRATNNTGGDVSGNPPLQCWTHFIPVQNRIYYESHWGTSLRTPRWFNMTTNAYEVGTGTPRSQTGVVGAYTGILVHIPERNILVHADAVTGPVVAIRYLPVGPADTDPSWVNVVTLSQPISVGTGFSCLAWVPSSEMVSGGPGKLILGCHTSEPTPGVYEIDIPTNLSSTWYVIHAPFGAGQSIAWPTSNGTEFGSPTYKSWMYNPTTKCIPYFPLAGKPSTGTVDVLYAYRPRGT